MRSNPHVPVSVPSCSLWPRCGWSVGDVFTCLFDWAQNRPGRCRLCQQEVWHPYETLIANLTCIWMIWGKEVPETSRKLWFNMILIQQWNSLVACKCPWKPMKPPKKHRLTLKKQVRDHFSLQSELRDVSDSNLAMALLPAGYTSGMLRWPKSHHLGWHLHRRRINRHFWQLGSARRLLEATHQVAWHNYVLIIVNMCVHASMSLYMYTSICISAIKCIRWHVSL